MSSIGNSGSPVWTRFELLQPKLRSARTCPKISSTMTSPQDWRGHPDRAPGLDAYRTAALLLPALSCSLEAANVIPNAVSYMALAAGRTLQKMRKNRLGWRIEELQAVAEENFVEWRRPGRGGSQVIFSAPGVRQIASVPAKRPIKPDSIKQFVGLVDAAGGIRTK